MDILRRLRLKGLITDDENLFSPLFVQYLVDMRAPQPSHIKAQAGPIRIDSTGEVWLNGIMVDPSLTPSELRLLTHLCSKAGQLVSKDEIIVAVYSDKYSEGENVSDAALTALVERLRKRLDSYLRPSQLILTVRGKGYMLQT